MSTYSSATEAQAIETYSPSGRIGLLSVPMMIIPGILFGMAVAFVIHLVWYYVGFYLMWFFPVGIGMAGGFGIALGGQVGKNRNVLLAIVLGVSIGVLNYGSMHYFDASSYGSTNMLEYLNEMADEGFYLFFFIPISGPFARLSWLIELGIVIFFTTAFAFGSAASPFCERCNRWTEDIELFSSDIGVRHNLVECIVKGEFHRMKELWTIGSGNLRVKGTLHFCDNCKQTGYMTLTLIQPKENDEKKTDEDILIDTASVGGNVSLLLRDFGKENMPRM
jgi:hypothetical protein